MRACLPLVLAAAWMTFSCDSSPSASVESASGGGGSSGGTSPGAGGQTASGGLAAGGSDASTGGRPGSGGDDNQAGAGSGGGSSGGSDPHGFSLVWADEFDGPALDTSKWTHETDCWGGGNNEDQCYVADAKNSFIEAGFLHIKVIKDSPSGPEGGGSGNTGVVTKGHSSARLRTLGQGDFKYGRMEARLKLPFGQGLWPAFWMLPTDNAYGSWAASGEIDILEAVNLNPTNEVFGTLHYGGEWPENTSTGSSFTPSSNAWEQFHVYAVEWEAEEVRWFVDETHYQTQNDWFSANADYPAPFNQRFHILLNVAVGGSWPGPPDVTTTFPQEMQVDYVRVYECSLDSATGHGCGTTDPLVQPL